jgi:hypothetical protein
VDIGVASRRAGVASAQTADQTINVRIIPATTVEEKVANEMKEKELRKAAEEKRIAAEADKIAETESENTAESCPCSLHVVKHRVL